MRAPAFSKNCAASASYSVEASPHPGPRSRAIRLEQFGQREEASLPRLHCLLGAAPWPDGRNPGEVREILS